MKDNIYIKILEFGFERKDGISFNEIVEELNIDLSDVNFKANFAIWFYSNFYNPFVEKLIVGQATVSVASHRITPSQFDEKVKPHNDIKSHIKGDAVSKYIDYMELSDARKSSRRASRFAFASICIAIASIIVSAIPTEYSEPPYNVIVTEYRDSTSTRKLNNSISCEITETEVHNSKRDSNGILCSKQPKENNSNNIK